MRLCKKDKTSFLTDRLAKSAEQKSHINEIQFPFPFRWAWRHDDVLSWSKGGEFNTIVLFSIGGPASKPNTINLFVTEPIGFHYESTTILAHFYNFMTAHFLGRKIHTTFNSNRPKRHVWTEIGLESWKFRWIFMFRMMENSPLSERYRRFLKRQICINLNANRI